MSNCQYITQSPMKAVQRVLEGGGPVLLEGEVADPREAVARDGHERAAATHCAVTIAATMSAEHEACVPAKCSLRHVGLRCSREVVGIELPEARVGHASRRRGRAGGRRGARPWGPRAPRCSGAAPASRRSRKNASASTKSGPISSCFTSSIEGGLHALEACGRRTAAPSRRRRSPSAHAERHGRRRCARVISLAPAHMSSRITAMVTPSTRSRHT